MAQEVALDQYKQDFRHSLNEYYAVKEKAEKEFSKMQAHGMADEHTSFWHWLASGAHPELSAKQNDLYATNARLLKCAQEVYGPNYKEKFPDKEYALIPHEMAGRGKEGILL